VSVISSDDPVRVFQEFATLDLLSGGRAEIMAGRGSFVAFAIIGGRPERFAPFAELHREAARRAGHRSASAIFRTTRFCARDRAARDGGHAGGARGGR
jgi:alkanesulfonate monooxygenase SsuD/methylene tetrahydromethanopterin reductase-like flavin-dependent oxidoreductase (luciferase family)